jgi:hypothetical protein
LAGGESFVSNDSCGYSDRYSLTTDQSTYQVGEPVNMTLTETNVSDQAVTVGPITVQV